MNTFSYLSAVFSSRPSTSSTTQESQAISIAQDPDDGESPGSVVSKSAHDLQGVDAYFISARRSSSLGDQPVVSVSGQVPPLILAQLREQGYKLDAKSEADSTAEIPQRIESHGEPGEHQFKKEADSKTFGDVTQASQGVKVQTETKTLKLTDKISFIARLWPVRFGVGLFVFLRRILFFLGLRLTNSVSANRSLRTTSSEKPSSDITDPPNTPPTSDPDTVAADDRDELLAKLASSVPSAIPRSSFFFRRHTPSDVANTSISRSSSPVLPTAPTNMRSQPPRLKPKTLVLDLDETLIHSTSRPYKMSGKGSGLKIRVVEVVLEGRSTVYTVYKRPWVDFFLRKVSTWYTVIIFTASLPEYADPVIDWLDGGDGSGGMVGARLFRADCLHANGAYLKDLSVVDSDLSRICLVDNSPASYAINQANGIPIEGWINDPNDECLLDLLPMLDSLRFTTDVRRVLGLRGFGK